MQLKHCSVLYFLTGLSYFNAWWLSLVSEVKRRWNTLVSRIAWLLSLVTTLGGCLASAVIMPFKHCSLLCRLTILSCFNTRPNNAAQILKWHSCLTVLSCFSSSLIMSLKHHSVLYCSTVLSCFSSSPIMPLRHRSVLHSLTVLSCFSSSLIMSLKLCSVLYSLTILSCFSSSLIMPPKHCSVLYRLTILACINAWRLCLVSEAMQFTVELLLPRYVTSGGSAELQCDYSVHKDQLHRVEWIRNGKKVFQYVNGRIPPFRNYSVPGAELDVSLTSIINVILCIINLFTFLCNWSVRQRTRVLIYVYVT
jgi:hypothetical protein